MTSSTPSDRIQVVDALRGFAIVAILLLHNLEHFDFWYFPQGFPAWLVGLDKGIWNTMFFLFSGKAYGIFALLFGFTFYIQQYRQNLIGKDFRGRFAWRLILLLGFGTLNSCFYQGDILTIYAILGFTLIPVAKLNNKTVLIIAIILLLQPFEIVKFILALLQPGQALPALSPDPYFAKMADYIPNGSLLDVIKGNLTNGKIGVSIWTWQSGRVFQTPGLFMVGMLLGRTRKFIKSNETKQFWKKILLFATIAFIPLYLLKISVNETVVTDTVQFTSLALMIKSWSDLAFMTILVSGFVLLYQYTELHDLLEKFSVLGKMSMSNYIIQSMLGAIIYYGFGMGAYLYTGASFSLLIGILLMITQWILCKYWLKDHRYGPFEGIWHDLTWIGSRK